MMMMMMVVMETMMVNICNDDCDIVIKVILVKEVMSCDVSPVAMFLFSVTRRSRSHRSYLLTD